MLFIFVHCTEKRLHPFVTYFRVWHLHCLLEETGLLFVVEKIIVCKAEGEFKDNGKVFRT